MSEGKVATLIFLVLLALVGLGLALLVWTDMPRALALGVPAAVGAVVSAAVVQRPRR